MLQRVCGGEGLTIRRLAWVRMPSGNARLYAGTLQGALLEVDFPTLSFKVRSLPSARHVLERTHG